MSNRRLLIKSRSSNEPQSHTSPQLGQQEDSAPNFRAMFESIPHKQLSDSSDIRDPTIYSRKVSRLSQFSQINQKQKSEESHLFENQNESPNNDSNNVQKVNQSSTTKFYWNLNWKTRSGLPQHADTHTIVKGFWNKLKQNSSVWDSELLKINLLQENYLKLFIPQNINQLDFILINHILYLFRLISYITVPLQASLHQVNSLFQIIIISTLIFNIFFQLYNLKNFNQRSRFALICNLDLAYIICFLLLQFLEQDRITKLIILGISVVSQSIIFLCHRNIFITDIYSSFRIILYIFYAIIYVNLMTNIWLLIDSEQENSYLDAFIFNLNNMTPFNSIYMEPNYTMPQYPKLIQIYSSIIQVITFLSYALLLLSLKKLYHLDQQNCQYINIRIELMTTYFHNNNVSKNLSQQAIDLLRQVVTKSQDINFKKINTLMQQLPHQLTQQITTQIKTQHLQKNQFFKTYFSLKAIQDIAQNAEIIQYNPNEVIASLDKQDESTYLIIKGKIGEHQQLGDSIQLIKFQSKNYLIGLDTLLTNNEQKLLYKSYGHSIVLKIENQSLIESIRMFPLDKEAFHNVKYEVLFNQKIELLLQQCSICNCSNHLTHNCPKVHFIPKRDYIWKRNLFTIPAERVPKERKQDVRFNSYSNYQTVRETARRYRKNNGYASSENEEYPYAQQIYDETIEDDYYENQNMYSYREITNPSKTSNLNVEKSKSIELLSGQTLKDLGHNQDLDEAASPNIFDINRHQIVKQTLQTAGFQQQQEDYLQESGINVPLQHKTFTQNSNTYKSSSQTYQSQKSQQRQQQKVHITAPPVDQNKLRVNQPKLTFSYDPLQSHQTSVESHQQPMFRPQYRSSTNYVQNSLQQQQQFPQGSILPIVSEESSSQLNIPFTANNLPYASAMSISSVGLASIDDNIRRDYRDTSNTYTGYKRISHKQQTNTSAISPGNASPGKASEQKRSGGTNSQSYLSSVRFQYVSDFDNDDNKVKASFDIDRGIIFDKYRPMNNYDIVVNQILIKMRTKNRNASK